VVVAGIQADFARLFCVPSLASRLLSPTGEGLNAKTMKAVRALAAERDAKLRALDEAGAERK
jgi:hypothetical protein